MSRLAPALAVLGILAVCLFSGKTAQAKGKGKGPVDHSDHVAQTQFRSGDPGKLVVYDYWDEGGDSWTVADGHWFENTMKATNPGYAVIMERRWDDIRALRWNLAAMELALKDRGRPFEEVLVYDHGGKGGLEMGGLWVNADFVRKNGDYFRQFGKYIAPGGTLSLAGCEVGYGKQGQELLRALAELMPHVGTIRAYTSYNAFIGDLPVPIPAPFLFGPVNPLRPLTMPRYDVYVHPRELFGRAAPREEGPLLPHARFDDALARAEGIGRPVNEATH